MSLASCGRTDLAVVRRGVAVPRRLRARRTAAGRSTRTSRRGLTTLAVNALAAGGRLDAHLPAYERARCADLAARPAVSRASIPTRMPRPAAGPGPTCPAACPTPTTRRARCSRLRHLGGATTSGPRGRGGRRALAARPAEPRRRHARRSAAAGARLPFDRSGADLTAHAVRAWLAWRDDLPVAAGGNRSCAVVRRAALSLRGAQRANGAFEPLWFGNEHARGERQSDLRHREGAAGSPSRWPHAASPTPTRWAPARPAGCASAQHREGGWGGDAGRRDARSKKRRWLWLRWRRACQPGSPSIDLRGARRGLAAPGHRQGPRLSRVADRALLRQALVQRAALSADLHRGRARSGRTRPRTMGMNVIYMDGHATTPVDPRVLDAMLPFFREQVPATPRAWITRAAAGSATRSKGRGATLPRSSMPRRRRSVHERRHRGQQSRAQGRGCRLSRRGRPHRHCRHGAPGRARHVPAPRARRRCG